MEVKQSEMTQGKWNEMREMLKRLVCADCGADLQIHTVAERSVVRVGCLDESHHGFMERETWTQAYRRGDLVPSFIEDKIKKKMMPTDELGRAMNLLALRYPTAIFDPPTAALFIMDCARLDLDPLISPAEAIPIPFKSKRRNEKGEVEEKVTIQMIITEDGWLSMAARGCKEEWNGPPRTMRLEEYLTTLKENEGKTREEIQAIAKEIKKSACKDENAWYYLAIGRSKSMTVDAEIPGWFTKRDMEKAEKGHLPAFFEPGNQARVRSIKKWVRHVYPECRQKMIDLTKEWMERAEGIQAAQEYIDAEYSFIALSEGEGGATEKARAAAPKVKSQATKTETPLTEETPPQEAIVGDGFSIDLTWLSESKKALKWTDDTCKTFLVGKYKVSPEGTLTEMLARLTREQAEDFVNQINSRVEKQASLF